MRHELLGHLHDLADRERLLDDCKGSLLDYAVHFLFDDTPLGEDPSRAVGWYLHDEAEARIVGAVADALDRVFDAHGTERTDGFYVSCEEWTAVQTAAAIAYAHLGDPTGDIAPVFDAILASIEGNADIRMRPMTACGVPRLILERDVEPGTRYMRLAPVADLRMPCTFEVLGGRFGAGAQDFDGRGGGDTAHVVTWIRRWLVELGPFRDPTEPDGNHPGWKAPTGT